MRSLHFGFVACIALAWPSLASADLLTDIKNNATLRLAVREDAPPFSSKNDKGDPVGYSVALCQAVAEDLKKQLGLSALKVEFVPVTAENRFKAITEKKADILCEATTVTLSRREQLDFSIPTFVSGAGLIIREGGPGDFKALAGKKIGVLGGTTTEEALRNSLGEQQITAEIVPAKTHDEGFAALESGSVDAYFADRTILRYRLAARKSPTKLLLSDNYLTIEPYALGVPLGETNLRLAVDRSLSKLYRSGAIVKLFHDVFGDKAKPTALQKALFTVSGLPE
ncbi:MAG: amino acid ABC transporter substrate-binding protein [Proteobacteria bacterium]|nr:amino acid ABC transporter substrate-binding protein [Pseudomonadota bacterium]